VGQVLPHSGGILLPMVQRESFTCGIMHCAAMSLFQLAVVQSIQSGSNRCGLGVIPVRNVRGVQRCDECDPLPTEWLRTVACAISLLPTVRDCLGGDVLHFLKVLLRYIHTV